MKYYNKTTIENVTMLFDNEFVKTEIEKEYNVIIIQTGKFDRENEYCTVIGDYADVALLINTFEFGLF